jgi:nicotinamide-nucleotide amidase
MIHASIITIGDELLIGQVIDTNSAWMAQQLNEAGIRVKRRVAVGDVWDEIWETLDEEKEHADIILITGGLGPTADDITKELLCAYFGGTLVVDADALARVTHLFEVVLKRPLTNRNLKQAEVPDNCRVMTNTKGSAPGMWFEQNGKIFISMPGVPHEMKGIMEEEVIPALIKRFTFPHIAHRTLLTFGIGESFLADLLVDFEANLPSYIKMAYLPNFSLVRLRLTASGKDAAVADKALDDLFTRLQVIVKDHLVTNTDELMEQVVGKLLKDRNKTLCTAESCTGGYIAHLLTLQPGASAYYDGSIVSYSYKAKEKLLQVDPQVLAEKGAVSDEVVREMAEGALKNIGSDYTIAVSGIMGPDGGMPGKPVGTVWIAVGNYKKIVSRKISLRFDRQRNIQITAVNALNMLREFILEGA